MFSPARGQSRYLCACERERRHRADGLPEGGRVGFGPERDERENRTQSRNRCGREGERPMAILVDQNRGRQRDERIAGEEGRRRKDLPLRVAEAAGEENTDREESRGRE